MAFGLVVRRRQLSTSMWSMGSGFLGCLGHGDWVTRPSLEEVVAMPISRVSAGWGHGAATTASGDVMLWGRTLDPPEVLMRLARLHGLHPFVSKVANSLSMMSDIYETIRLSPAMIPGVKAAGAACGAGVTAVWTQDGQLLTMGANGYGQCGLGTHSAAIETPTAVEVGERVVDAALGFRHGLCVGESGAVFAWGKNGNGQLGNGSFEDSLTPARVLELDNIHVVSVSTGMSHCAALDSHGRVYVWGKMRSNEIKKKSIMNLTPRVHMDAVVPRSIPLQVAKAYRYRAPKAPVRQIACSNFHTVLLDANYDIWMLGLRQKSRDLVLVKPELVKGLPPDRKWTIRSGVESVAIFDVASPADTLPIFTPRLTSDKCEAVELCKLHKPAAFTDVSIGWKHTVVSTQSKGR